MPAILANAKNFLLNTDYPLDKVVYLYSGSLALSGSSYPVVTLNHNLPFTPLLGGGWSTDPNFTITYEYDAGPLSTNPSFLTNQYIGVASNSSTVRVNFGNNLGSGLTVYYRIFGLQPTGVEDSEVPIITTSQDNFILNTRYNYTKLFMSGSVVVPAAGASPVTSTVFHNLGYIPQAMVWEESAGYIRPMTTADLSGSGSRSAISSTSISFTIPEFSSSRTYHYRIYLDE